MCSDQPVPEVDVPGDPALERDVGVRLQAGIFRLVFGSLPLRYSIGGIVISSPVASLNDPLTATPSSLTSLTMTWKL